MHKTFADMIISCGLLLLISVLGMVGFGFIVAGVYLLMAAQLSAWASALLTGSTVLLLAILMLLTFRLARGSAADPEREQRGRGSEGGPPPDAARSAELFELAIELAAKSSLNARDATLIALIAGTMVGVSPALRRQLLGMFAPAGGEDEAR